MFTGNGPKPLEGVRVLELATFDLENGGKRSLALNVKDPEGRNILFKLFDQ